MRLPLFFSVLFSFFCLVSRAQLCNGSLGDPIININFGSGTNPGPALAAAATGYQYLPADCPNDGYYTVITNTQKVAQNSNLFGELDELNKRRIAIRSHIDAISQYQKEYEAYKRNLNKSADSLQPIEFLNEKLSDQLVDSYETKAFVESLESSLKSIKENLSKKIIEPIKVTGDAKELNRQLKEIENKISKLNEIKKNYLAESQTEVQKFIVLGEIKLALEQLLKLELGNLGGELGTLLMLMN